MATLDIYILEANMPECFAKQCCRQAVLVPCFARLPTKISMHGKKNKYLLSCLPLKSINELVLIADSFKRGFVLLIYQANYSVHMARKKKSINYQVNASSLCSGAMCFMLQKPALYLSLEVLMRQLSCTCFHKSPCRHETLLWHNLQGTQLRIYGMAGASCKGQV